MCRTGQLGPRLTSSGRPAALSSGKPYCAYSRPPARPAFGPPRAYSAPQPRKRRRHPERPPGSAPRCPPALAGIAAFLKARLLRGHSEGPHADRAGGHRASQRPSTKPPRAARKRRRGGSEDCLSRRRRRVLDRAPGKRASGSFLARSGKLQLSPGQFLSCRAGAQERLAHACLEGVRLPMDFDFLELVEDGADFGQLVAVGGDDGDVAGVEARLLADHFDIVL